MPRASLGVAAGARSALVISTIVMLRFFARRQRASMSAYFTNSLTPPSGLGLLVAPRPGFSRSGSAWPGRSQKDGLPSYRGGYFIAVQGHQPAHRGGAAWLLPLLIGSGNGRQNAMSLLC
jgi:hypothetical protein